jgi:hypothetical protein
MNKVSVLARSVAAGTITVTSRALRLAAQAGDQVAARVRPRAPEPRFDPTAAAPTPVTGDPSSGTRPAVERAFDDETIPPAPVDPVVEDVVEPLPVEDLDETAADEVPDAFADDVAAGVAPGAHPEDVVADLDTEQPLVVSGGPDPVTASAPAEPVTEAMTEEGIAALAERNAADVIAAVPALSTQELRLLLEHETANKNRKTVLQAVEAAAESRTEQ